MDCFVVEVGLGISTSYLMFAFYFFFFFLNAAFIEAVEA